MIVAGVMSGSSLDGLDVAIIQFTENKDWKLLWTYDTPYSKDWVDRLKTYHQLSAIEFIAFKLEYSKYIGGLLEDGFAKYVGTIDYISFHGHTLMHLPERGITEQIGNGGVLAAMLNVPTITDFRTQDVIKGGVGTPLAPLVETNLFSGHDYYLNLGGIANITKLIDANNIMAYDVCPCNQVLNFYCNQIGKEYDDGGMLARGGSTHTPILTYLNSIPYFKLSAPKSLDNNWIINEVIPNIPKAKTEDVLHTFCNWMANCISNEVEETVQASSLMATGGGTHNTYFIECLKEALLKKNCNLHIPSNEIIDFKEAILMALMAYKYVKGEPNVLSIVTGASSDSIGGAMYKA